MNQRRIDTIVAATGNVDTAIAVIDATAATPPPSGAPSGSFAHRLTPADLTRLAQAAPAWAAWTARCTCNWQLLDALVDDTGQPRCTAGVVEAAASNPTVDDTTLARLVRSGTTTSAADQLLRRYVHAGFTGFGHPVDRRYLRRLAQRVDTLATGTLRARQRTWKKLTSPRSFRRGNHATVAATITLDRHGFDPSVHHELAATLATQLDEQDIIDLQRRGASDQLIDWLDHATGDRRRRHYDPRRLDTIADILDHAAGELLFSPDLHQRRRTISDAIETTTKPWRFVADARHQLMAGDKRAADTTDLCELVLTYEHLDAHTIDHAYQICLRQLDTGNDPGMFAAVLTNAAVDTDALDNAISTATRQGHTRTLARAAANCNTTAEQLSGIADTLTTHDSATKDLLATIAGHRNVNDHTAARVTAATERLGGDLRDVTRRLAVATNTTVAWRRYAPVDVRLTAPELRDVTVEAVAATLAAAFGDNRNAWHHAAALADTWHGTAGELADTVNALT